MRITILPIMLREKARKLIMRFILSRIIVVNDPLIETQNTIDLSSMDWKPMFHGALNLLARS